MQTQQTDTSKMEFEERLGYTFKNKELLKRALTHRSYVKDKAKSNERLEFLGDAVLELVVTEFLINNYKNIDEGKLSKIRAASVNTKTLSKLARKLELSDQILVGRSEKKEGITNNDSILEDAFEAIVGAIYLDGGLDKARRFVEHMLKDTIIAIVENGIIFDYKTHLQEITQKQFGCLPEYVIVKEDGQEHNKTFYCDVMIKGVKYGFGIGKSKKDAEKNAAKEAVKKLEQNDV